MQQNCLKRERERKKIWNVFFFVILLVSLRPLCTSRRFIAVIWNLYIFDIFRIANCCFRCLNEESRRPSSRRFSRVAQQRKQQLERQSYGRVCIANNAIDCETQRQMDKWRLCAWTRHQCRWCNAECDRTDRWPEKRCAISETTNSNLQFPGKTSRIPSLGVSRRRVSFRKTLIWFCLSWYCLPVAFSHS